MLEKFSGRARPVVVVAREEARMLGSNHIGTGHHLRDLIHDGADVAARALESLGISPEVVRQQVEEFQESTGRRRQATSGNNPLTPLAKKMLEPSLRKVLLLGLDYIGTEQVLLALIRERQGAAAHMLARLGADLNRVRQQLTGLLAGYPGQGEPGIAGGAGDAGRAGRRERDLLAELLSQADSLQSRLSAVEHRVGTGPRTCELDQQIDQARRDREAAVSAQDYEMAAVLRDRERQLLARKASRQDQWAAAHPDLPALAEELHGLHDQVERLRGLLARQRIEPQDGTA